MQTGDEVGEMNGKDSGLCSVVGFNSDAGHALTPQNSASQSFCFAKLTHNYSVRWQQNTRNPTCFLRRHLPAERRITTGTFTCVPAVCNYELRGKVRRQH